MTTNKLREGYFRLRQESDAFKADSEKFAKFEGLPWTSSVIERKADDGTVLRVYEVEGDIEACIINRDGQSKTYC